jgi:hypothetical protein
MQPVEIRVPDKIAAMEAAAHPDWMHEETSDADTEPFAGH